MTIIICEANGVKYNYRTFIRTKNYEKNYIRLYKNVYGKSGFKYLKRVYTV